MDHIKENSKIINRFVYISIIVLLLPFIPLIWFDNLHDNNFYFNFVSLAYVVCMWALYIFAKSELVQKGISDSFLLSYVNKYVYLFVLGLLIPALVCADKENLIVIIKRLIIIFTVPIYKFIYKYFEINKSIRDALLFCTAVGIFICITETLFLHRYRPGGFTLNANTWSAYLGFVLPLFWYGAWKSKKSFSIYGIMGCGTLLCIFLAKSRAMLIGLTVITLCCILYLLFKYNKKIFSTVFFVLLSMFLYLILNINSLLSRDYDYERLATYIAAWKMFLDNPIFGVGYIYFQEYCKMEYMRGMSFNLLPHAHNMYLQFLATTGIVGTLGFLGFLLFYLKLLTQRFHDNKYFIVGFVSLTLFLLHGVFDSVVSIFYTFRYWMFFLTIYEIDIFYDICNQK